MDLVDVDVVGLQSLERILARTDHVQTRVTVIVGTKSARIVEREPRPPLAVIHFRRDDDVMAPTVGFQRSPDDLLAFPRPRRRRRYRED